MSKPKYDYWVAEITGRTEHLCVTSVDYSTRNFLCETDKPPKVFTKERAEDLMQGMILNGVPACIIQVPKGRYRFVQVDDESEDDNE